MSASAASTLEGLIRDTAEARSDAVVVPSTNLAAPLASRPEAAPGLPVRDSVAAAVFGASDRIGSSTDRIRDFGLPFSTPVP